MSQIEAIDEQTLASLTGLKIGISDAPCPLCGPYARAETNRRRKVLRIWNNDGFLTYKCARCGAQGSARNGIKRPWVPLPAVDNTERMRLAERLWGQSRPIAGSPVEVYLRLRKCYYPSPSIRYLPPNSKHVPTMITKFQGTSAVHLTRLRPDGMGKAGTEHDKVMIGPCSGFPMVLRSNQWSKPLLICEGIEDGLSLALAFPQWTIWAAGSSGHIPKLVQVADKQVVAIFDFDMAGIKMAKRAFALNPEVSIIKFPKGMDPNVILCQYGLNELRARVTCHPPFHR